MTKRREFSRPVKIEIMQRAKRTTGFQCEKCGVVVTRGEVDHVTAEGLVADKSKRLTAKEGQFLCLDCHRGPGGKTAADVEAIARAKRVEGKHTRAIVPAATIKSAPMPTTERAAKRQSKPPVIRQHWLYRDI